MKILLTHRVRTLVSYLVAIDPKHEVNGFGKVERTEKGDIVITDLIVPPQEVGSAHTHMGTDEFAWAMEELASRGETMADWNCWWHSHASMQVFASTTDVPTLEKFAQMLTSKWACGFVTNAKNEFYGWIHADVEPCAMTLEKVEVGFELPPIDKDLATLAAQMMQNVELAKPAPVKTIGPVQTRVPFPGRKQQEVIAVWCDTHSCYDTFCVPPHDVPIGDHCQHELNCGETGCFSKKERKFKRSEYFAAVAELKELEDDYPSGFWDDDMPYTGDPRLKPGDALYGMYLGGD